MHLSTITNRCAEVPQLLNTPPWHADFNRRGLAKPDHGGKQETNGGKLAFIRAVQAFTCHGAAVPPPILIQLTFTSHTGSLFLSLYAPRYCLTASAGFGRQFAKLRALSRLRRRYDSRKKRILLSPVSFPTPPPCGQDWLPWCECSAGTPPDRPPSCRPQSAA